MLKTFYLTKRSFESSMHNFVTIFITVVFLVLTSTVFFLQFFEQAGPLTMRSFFHSSPLWLAILCPALTMNLFSDERRDGTLDLLMTMPVSDVQIVLSKFLTGILTLFIALAGTLAFPLSLMTLGELDWGPVWGGYIGLFFLGAAYCAIGCCVSIFFRDPIVTLSVSLTLCFALYFIEQFSLTGLESPILYALSANRHFMSIARGVVDIRDMAYYVFVQVFALFICTQKLRALRH